MSWAAAETQAPWLSCFSGSVVLVEPPPGAAVVVVVGASVVAVVDVVLLSTDVLVVGSTDVELVDVSSCETVGRGPDSVAATATPPASSTAAATPATTRARMSLSITTVLQGGFGVSRFSSLSTAPRPRHNDCHEEMAREVGAFPVFVPLPS